MGGFAPETLTSLPFDDRTVASPVLQPVRYFCCHTARQGTVVDVAQTTRRTPCFRSSRKNRSLVQGNRILVNRLFERTGSNYAAAEPPRQRQRAAQSCRQRRSSARRPGLEVSRSEASERSELPPIPSLAVFQDGDMHRSNGRFYRGRQRLRRASEWGHGVVRCCVLWP